MVKCALLATDQVALQEIKPGIYPPFWSIPQCCPAHFSWFPRRSLTPRGAPRPYLGVLWDTPEPPTLEFCHGFYPFTTLEARRVQTYKTSIAWVWDVSVVAAWPDLRQSLAIEALVNQISVCRQSSMVGSKYWIKLARRVAS